MTGPLLIAGMWGTTNLRAFLLRAGSQGPEIMDTVSGPGASRIAGVSFETALSEAIAPWLTEPVRPAIMLAGMVGSTIGWRDAGYTPCPVTPGEVKLAPVFRAGEMEIRIVSGLSCVNPLGAPDVMRGEETELAGLLALRPELGEGAHLVCIPGTHAKWVALREGRVETFCTSVAGELFDVLTRNGVLVPAGAGQDDCVGPGDAFEDGLDSSRRQAGHFLNALFGVRARQVTGKLSPGEARERLSGLVIGEDVRSAAQMFEFGSGSITIIGSDTLASRYETAIQAHGVTCECLPAETASAAGLWYFAGRCGVFEEDS